MSAPDRKYTSQGYTGPSYLDDMIELIQRAATKDIVLDRSAWGELIWPQIYSRKPLLSEEDIEILREMEDSVGVRRILMHDPDREAHWNRCVANNEPLTRPQFMRAATMYERMANKYGFEKINLAETPNYEPVDTVSHRSPQKNDQVQTVADSGKASLPSQAGKSKEQSKLEKANAINEVLSKRIVKSKTPVFDEIESEVRNFLQKMLGTILGSEDRDALSQEEIFIIRAFVKRLKEKDTK